MIAFCHADRRFPFLWESPSQQTGGWNAGDGVTHNLCDTPDGAWAEFLRLEEIDDPRDLITVRRAIWAVDIGDPTELQVSDPEDVLLGNLDSWPACQQIAQSYREFAAGIVVPSAALRPGGARGWTVNGGLQSGPERDSKVIVLFGPRPDSVGWTATIEGRPDESLLPQVRHFD